MTVDPLRQHLVRQLDLPTRMGAQLGVVSDQYAGLRRGQPVTLHRDQLAAIGAHPSKDAVDLEASEWWLLDAADQLTPTDPPT